MKNKALNLNIYKNQKRTLQDIEQIHPHFKKKKKKKQAKAAN